MPRTCGNCGVLSGIMLLLAAMLFATENAIGPILLLIAGSLAAALAGLGLGAWGLMGNDGNQSRQLSLYRLFALLNGALLVAITVYLIR